MAVDQGDHQNGGVAANRAVVAHGDRARTSEKISAWGTCTGLDERSSPVRNVDDRCRVDRLRQTDTPRVTVQLPSVILVPQSVAPVLGRAGCFSS